MMPGMARLGGMSASDSGGGAIADPKINADEELGAERPAADAKAGDSKSSSPTSSSGSPTGPTGGHAGPMAMPTGSQFGMGGFGGTRGGGSNMERYRDDQPEWKTRGFTLQVVMDHRRIPDLLVALSNCDWPINILRIHEADYKDEDLVSADGSGAGSGMMPMPGRSGGSPMGSRGMSGPGLSGPPGGHAAGMPRGGLPPMPKASAPRSFDESGEGSFNPRSTMDDPNLANVSIVGVIYIFKKPPPETAAPAAPQQSTAGAVQPAPGTAAVPAAEAKSTADESDDSEPAKSDDEKPDEASDTPGDSSAKSSGDSGGDSSGDTPGGSTKDSPGGRG